MTPSDYKEIEEYKGDIKSKECFLEAQKLSYANKLKKGFGKEIINYLDNPPKPKNNNIINQLKKKISRMFHHQS